MKTSVWCYLAVLAIAVVNAENTGSIFPADFSPDLHTARQVESAMRRPRDADGEVADSDAVRQTAQGLEAERQAQEAFRLQVLQALRLQEEGAERRAATALQLLERRDQAIQALRLSLQGVEERLEALVQQLNQTENQGPAANGQLLPHPEDNCVKNLEATVKRVLEQLASCESNASITNPSSTSNTTTSITTVARQPAAPTSSGGTSPGALAAEDEETEKRRAEQRAKDVRAKMEISKAAPSELGEDLCKAANQGNQEEIRRLLDSGADVNYTSWRNGSSPLISSFFYNGVIAYCNPEVLSLLLERGADVEATNEDGMTALHLAALLDSPGRCVELLIAAGADVNARNLYGVTPLRVAAEAKNDGAVHALLAAGARNINAWNGYITDMTPFDVAAYEAAVGPVRRQVELLVEEVKVKMERAKAAPSQLGEDLCKAAIEGKLEDVRRLLDAGVDVNFISGEFMGVSPLMAAINYDFESSSNNSDVLSLLLERGADVKAVDVEGRTALHLAASVDSSGQLVPLLLNAGADVNARDKEGATPLHNAGYYKIEAAVRALLAAGARKDLRCWSGWCKHETPFGMAYDGVICRLLVP